jgi:hypothetical protein
MVLVVYDVNSDVVILYGNGEYTYEYNFFEFKKIGDKYPGEDTNTNPIIIRNKIY